MKSVMLLAITATIILSSCGDSRKLQYLQGPLEPTAYAQINYKEPVVQFGDILSITVYSDDARASALYNQLPVSVSAPQTISSGSSGASNTVQGSNAGYLVDPNGNIYFHSLGNIPVRGLTRAQVATLVSSKLDTVLKHPYCQVRFLNFKVTVLGEVKNPAVFSIPSEKVSVLEVLGLAGDLTDYARRDSVMIVREVNNERKFGWVDVRRTDIFNSEYFYLQQNDVVVVNPVKKKPTASDQLWIRNISIVTSIISTLAILVNVIK